MPDAPSPSPAQLERWRPPLRDGRHHRHPLGSPDVAMAWNGVVWSRLGRCDHAFAWWDEVADPALDAWVLAERARVLRELGLHAAARELDEQGLRRARDLVDVVLLRLSLVADAVGLGELDAARGGLTAVDPLLAELDATDPRVQRQQLRRTWVGVEVAFLAGERPAATDLPGRGVGAPTFPPAYAAGTDFHRAKGLLFGGVVRADPGLLRAAAELAPPMLLWAVELARLDLGDATAAARALAAWAGVVPPPAWADRVALGATARRFAGLSG